MRLNARMIATVAFVVFLMSALSLLCGGSAKPSPREGCRSDVQSPSRKLVPSSMAAAMPYSEGMNIGTPRFELFLGYSYLRAVPTLADGNRLVWLNGGSTSIAYNFNRYLGAGWRLWRLH